jgi:hypothetical protein
MNNNIPEHVIQKQLAAYNAKDLEQFLATYAPDAEQWSLHGELLAKGHAEMRERYQVRFAEPDLHARLISRSVIGNFVTDYECVTRNFPEGVGSIEMLCIYEVQNGRIIRASFTSANQKIHRSATQ